MAKLLQDAAATRKRVRKVAEEEDKISASANIFKQPSLSDQNALKSDLAISKIQEENNNSLLAKKKKISTQNLKKSSSESKVVYVGHIPHGFYEKEMRKFFSQFGDVKRIKLFRSQKTNRSKGYAFVEFIDSDAAKVVAESMHGYFIQDKQLVCHIIPLEKQHDGMFKPPKTQQPIVSKKVIATEEIIE